MIGEGERGFLVVRPDVLRGGTNRIGIESCFRECRAVSESNHAGDQITDLIRSTDTSHGGPSSSGEELSVVGRAKTKSLVDSRMQRLVELRRKRATRGLVGFVVDDDRVVLDDWNIHATEECKRSTDDITLEGHVIRFAQRPAQRELTMQEARCLDVLGLTADDRNPDGGDAGCFKDPCEHTNGARAKRSNRGQQDDVDTVLAKHPSRSRPGVEEDRGERGVGLRTHE